MWVFTKKSFLSVVEYDPSKDLVHDSPFRKMTSRKGTHLLVRARVRADLEPLRSVVKNLVISEDKIADYQFRAVLPRAKFEKFMATQVHDIDYGSHFKEVVKANATESSLRYRAMMNVWSDMLVLQPLPTYKDWYKDSKGTVDDPTPRGDTKSWKDSGWVEGKDGIWRKPGGKVRDPRSPHARQTYEDWRKEQGYEAIVPEVKSYSYPATKSVGSAYKDGKGMWVSDTTSGTVTATGATGAYKDKDGVWRSTSSSDIDLDAWEEDYYDSRGVQQTLGIAQHRVGLEEAEAHLLEYGTDIPAEWYEALDDEGFELMTRVQEVLGPGVQVTQEQISDVLDEIINDGLVAEPTPDKE